MRGWGTAPPTFSIPVGNPEVCGKNLSRGWWFKGLEKSLTICYALLEKTVKFKKLTIRFNQNNE